MTDTINFDYMARLQRLRRAAILLFVLVSWIGAVRDKMEAYGYSIKVFGQGLVVLAIVLLFLWVLSKIIYWVNAKFIGSEVDGRQAQPGLSELLEGALIYFLLWSLVKDIPKGEWRSALMVFRYSIPLCAASLLSGVECFGWYDNRASMRNEFAVGLLMVLLMILSELVTGCTFESMAPSSIADVINMFILLPVGTALAFNGLCYGVIVRGPWRGAYWIVVPISFMLLVVQPNSWNDRLHMVIVSLIGVLGLRLAIRMRTPALAQERELSDQM